MKKQLIKITLLFITTLALFHPTIKAQNAEIGARLTALRDNFVADIKSFGYNTSLLPPEIVLDNPKSFGNYDDSANVLHTTGDWQTLPQQLKDFFNHLANGKDSSDDGKDFFEKATHKWVFIHELGHWWRACEKQKALPYQEELGANRIAVAYWREKDPAFMNWQLEVFKNIVNHFPNPVPPDESKEKYFNDNYNTLAGQQAYIYFQAEMIIQAYNEKPFITFKIAVANAGN